MQLEAQGHVDNEQSFLQKTRAKDTLDLEFFDYERKVILNKLIKLKKKFILKNYPLFISLT